jgi:hypothetical protein
MPYDNFLKIRGCDENALSFVVPNFFTNFNEKNFLTYGNLGLTRNKKVSNISYIGKVVKRKLIRVKWPNIIKPKLQKRHQTHPIF